MASIILKWCIFLFDFGQFWLNSFFKFVKHSVATGSSSQWQKYLKVIVAEGKEPGRWRVSSCRQSLTCAFFVCIVVWVWAVVVLYTCRHVCVWRSLKSTGMFVIFYCICGQALPFWRTSDSDNDNSPATCFFVFPPPPPNSLIILQLP